MSTKRDVSSEFASLLSQLRQSPDCINVKIAIVQRLPEMKILAKSDALALYRLAQLHPTHSNQYREMIQEAADRGCTNAMLDYCRILVTSKKTESQSQIDQYLQNIMDSGDEYIQQEAREFIAECVAAQPAATQRSGSYAGFFDGKNAEIEKPNNYYECFSMMR